ncbi:hypothetical protein FOXYS1_14256 [Fusarium oxysporum]|uniref:FAS1 domain-containing protein n=1 Tax=Fusarium oxysporum TaxID=5507 RepID=A0A8H4ZYT8_FUSOX|nr:hypothetical protein FOXYS1_14256 [Fusarium oxysporum]
MKLQNYLPLALTRLAIGILEERLGFATALDRMVGVTILAPSDDAIHSFFNNTTITKILTSNPAVFKDVLSYHVLNGTYFTNNLTEASMFIETMLQNSTFENVTGGQVVEARKDGDTVSFYSALKTEANITRADLSFTGGVVHIINRVLDIPMDLSATAIDSNPTSTFPAFSGASTISGGSVPFTSNVPAPTETAAGLVTLTGSRTWTFTDVGVPHATAAVAFGAFFGGVAMVMNGL